MEELKAAVVENENSEDTKPRYACKNIYLQFITVRHTVSDSETLKVDLNS